MAQDHLQAYLKGWKQTFESNQLDSALSGQLRRDDHIDSVASMDFLIPGPLQEGLGLATKSLPSGRSISHRPRLTESE